MPVEKITPKEEIKRTSTGSSLTNPVVQKEILEGVKESIEIAGGVAELQPKTEQDLISETDPGAAAGALFALYGSRFFGMVNAMSNKQLKRLVKALVTYPLEDVFVNKKVSLEMNAYHIGNEMITSRFLATLAHTYQAEEERKALLEEKKNGSIVSSDSESLARQVSELTANTINESMKNFQEGKAGDPVDLTEFNNQGENNG